MSVAMVTAQICVYEVTGLLSVCVCVCVWPTASFNISVCHCHTTTSVQTPPKQHNITSVPKYTQFSTHTHTPPVSLCVFDQDLYLYPDHVHCALTHSAWSVQNSTHCSFRFIKWIIWTFEEDFFILIALLYIYPFISPIKWYRIEQNYVNCVAGLMTRC